ncbi:MAG TPA: hypothetical protein VFP57_01940 [Sphingomicrobium sp.]|jgi:hypothetical protein|nr:hypothetical protein [Sphingomicrobium sp.]
MDLNYLYHRRGLSLLLAQHAASEKSRRNHRAASRAYASSIRDVLRDAWPADA